MESTMIYEGTEEQLLAEQSDSALPEEQLFFSDTSPMTSWPLPTTAYTISEPSYVIGVSELDTMLYEEPPYDPDAEYSLPSAKQCFNCMSTTHIVSDCPYKRNAQHIALARADYGARGGIARSLRFHEAEEKLQRRTEYATKFQPGYVQDELLRESLGLPGNYGGGNEDLPWYFNMCDWGYPPGWVAFTDPREKIMERIKLTSVLEAMENFKPLIIFEEDVANTSSEPAVSPVSTGFPKLESSLATQPTLVLAVVPDPAHNHPILSTQNPPLPPDAPPPPPPPDFPPPSLPLPGLFPPPPPPSSPPPPPPGSPPPPPTSPPPPPPDDPPPPPPDTLPFPPQRWAHYRTTLFQSERLPVSLVYRPLPDLSGEPPSPPPPSAPAPPPRLVSASPPKELSEADRRRLLWEQILAGQQGR